MGMNAVDAKRHSFTIPVMGIAFTIDSPLKVGRYGISSTVSLVDDLFLEQMRKHHCDLNGLNFEPIPRQAPDGRARRTTAYLNLLHRLLNQQIEEVRAQDFVPGSDLTRYFELLPEGELRARYDAMLACEDAAEKAALQDALRREVIPGAINANIMTKLDRDRDAKGNERPLGDSDALAAARGFAKSDVDGSLILSAGMNPRLFAYIATLEEFRPDDNGYFRKRLVLKVSDYRSAEVQGKVLAKKGIWVSEYRIESGLNCGGHAFATAGLLTGPILAEFREKREALGLKLMELYNKAVTKEGRPTIDEPFPCHVTMQGGIGTAAEQLFLHEHYQVDSTGWGTPFLLCPEASTLDETTRLGLAGCKDDEIQLSPNSPLNVPFWNYTNSASEQARRTRNESGRSGSACPKGFVAFNHDFYKVPLCRASRSYRTVKMKHLDETGAPAQDIADNDAEMSLKSCICHDLSGAATLMHGIDEKATPAVCPGPNIVNFSRIVSLDEMLGHIYGRINIIERSDRPHMFLRELELYVDEYHRQLAEGAHKLAKYEANLRSGIEYYRELAREHFGDWAASFVAGLEAQLARMPAEESEDEGAAVATA